MDNNNKLVETNNRLTSHQSTVEAEALRQSEQAIQASIAPVIEQIAYQATSQNAIAITEKIVRESINKGVGKALQEVGSVLSTISQETSDRFALSVLQVQSNCSKADEFSLPSITIQTKSLAESLGELTEEQSSISLQYKDKMKAIKEFQEEDLPDL